MVLDTVGLTDQRWPEKLQELQDALSRSAAFPILVVEPSGRPLASCEDLTLFCRRFTRAIPVARPCLDCGRAGLPPEQPEYVCDPDRHEPRSHWCPLGLTDIAAPVYCAGHLIGFIVSAQGVTGEDRGGQERRPDDDLEEAAALLYRRSPRVAPDDLRRIESLLSLAAGLVGTLASARLRNQRLAGKMRELSAWVQQHTTTDTVTGVANSRQFLAALTTEIQRVRRYRRPVALAVFQLAHHLEIEEEFGREVAGMLLRAVAQRLTLTLRQTDTVGRVGSDTFAVLLPETTRIQAQMALDRALVAIGDLNASGEYPVEAVVVTGVTEVVGDPAGMLQAAQDLAAVAWTSELATNPPAPGATLSWLRNAARNDAR